MLRKRQKSGSLTHGTPEKSAKASKTSNKQKSPQQSTAKSKVKVLSKGKSTSKKTKGSSNSQSKKNSKVIETTKEHFEVIDAILQWNVHYVHPLKSVSSSDEPRLIASSGFSAEFIVFAGFPVLTRKPVGRGQLPVVPESDKSDVGYFLGAAHPGHIRLAVIEAFCTIFPNEDPKAARWENWRVWQNLSLYYPPDVFNRKPETLGDLAEDILTGREFGGLNRTLPKLVSTINQNLWSFAVPLETYYEATGYPVPEGDILRKFKPTFYPMNHLLSLHEDFKQALADKKESGGDSLVIKKKTTRKRLQKVEENDDEEDEDEEEETQGQDEQMQEDSGGHSENQENETSQNDDDDDDDENKEE